jgi:hypothetical protein
MVNRIIWLPVVVMRSREDPERGGGTGHNRSDAHAVSDRGRAPGENAPRRWLATVLAGCAALALHQRRSLAVIVRFV